MRTSIDFPDGLFRTLKAEAALQGTSLREHVLHLIERGMQQPAPTSPTVQPIPAIPTVDFGALPPALMTSHGINAFLMDEEYQKYRNVAQHGRSGGAAPHEAG